MEEQRPTPLVTDLADTRLKLGQWLSQRKGCDVAVSALDIPQATGMSNVTLMFNISWEEQGAQHSEACVGRLQPEIERPIFPAYDLSLQYLIMEALSEKTDLPAPTMRGLEMDPTLLGVPFYIMRKTEGRIPTDLPPYNTDGWMMHDIGVQQRESLWNAGVDTMARFHQLDFTTLGLPPSIQPEVGSSPLQQQLHYWRNYMNWAMEGRGHVICKRALDWLEANQPGAEIARLCWGDSRIANMIFTQDCTAVAAMLDWEMAVVGNPVQDLAWYCFIDSAFAEGLGLPRLAGLPSYDATVTRWKNATGYPVDNFDYYTVFAGMRFGLIMSRIMLAQSQDSDIQDNFVTALLAKKLEKHG